MAMIEKMVYQNRAVLHRAAQVNQARQAQRRSAQVLGSKETSCGRESAAWDQLLLESEPGVDLPVANKACNIALNWPAAAAVRGMGWVARRVNYRVLCRGGVATGLHMSVGFPLQCNAASDCCPNG